MRVFSAFPLPAILAMLLAFVGDSRAQTVDFGSVQLGTFKDSSVTVTNTYPLAITVTSLTVFNSPSDFSIISGGTTPFTVQPLATHTVIVRFQPTALGMRTDSLVIVTTLATVYIPLTGNGIPLPVELESFAATASAGGVILRWRTAAETNNAGFEVQRSFDGGEMQARNFETLAFIAGHGTTRLPHAYAFTDTFAPGPADERRWYRLRQVDYDGTAWLSPEVILHGIPSVATEGLQAIFPNPFRHRATIRYTVSSPAHVALTVHDMLGREMARLHDGPQDAGLYASEFVLGDLPAGMYLARLATGARITTVLLHADGR